MEIAYNRLTDALWNYWNALCLKSGKEMPLESQIDPDQLEGFWEDCFLIESTNHGYAFNYMGENLIEAYGKDLDNETMTKTMLPKNHPVARRYDIVTVQRKPMHDSSEFINSSGQKIYFRQLLLPFADSEGKIKYVLGGMRWKAS
jgi:hypothetical protein